MLFEYVYADEGRGEVLPFADPVGAKVVLLAIDLLTESVVAIE